MEFSRSIGFPLSDSPNSAARNRYCESDAVQMAQYDPEQPMADKELGEAIPPPISTANWHSRLGALVAFQAAGRGTDPSCRSLPGSVPERTHAARALFECVPGQPKGHCPWLSRTDSEERHRAGGPCAVGAGNGNQDAREVVRSRFDAWRRRSLPDGADTALAAA